MIDAHWHEPEAEGLSIEHSEILTTLSTVASRFDGATVALNETGGGFNFLGINLPDGAHILMSDNDANVIGPGKCYLDSLLVVFYGTEGIDADGDHVYEWGSEGTPTYCDAHVEPLAACVGQFLVEWQERRDV